MCTECTYCNSAYRTQRTQERTSPACPTMQKMMYSTHAHGRTLPLLYIALQLYHTHRARGPLHKTRHSISGKLATTWARCRWEPDGQRLCKEVFEHHRSTNTPTSRVPPSESLPLIQTETYVLRYISLHSIERWHSIFSQAFW